MVSTKLHQTLEFIEEDFNAGRITFREALEAYEEFLRDGAEVEPEAAYERGFSDGYDAAAY